VNTIILCVDGAINHDRAVVRYDRRECAGYKMIVELTFTVCEENAHWKHYPAEIHVS